MPDTVSNASRDVATKGSNHQAVSGPPDVCIMSLSIHTNTVPTTRLTAGRTTNTLIAQQPIQLDRTHVGPLSDPVHPGLGGGIISRTYRLEAQAITYSRDVFAESGPVVRSFDLTTQNHRNTVGMMMSAIYMAELEAQEREKKKKCVIDVFKGHCGHGRELGYPGEDTSGKPRYLEVLIGETLTFNTERKDVTDKAHAKNPTCAKGTHTEWYAEGVKFPSPTGAKARKPEGGFETTEEFTVDTSLIMEPWIMFMLGYDMAPWDDNSPHDRKDSREAKHKTAEEQKEVPRKTRQDFQDAAKIPPGSNRRKREQITKQANKDYDEYARKNSNTKRAEEKANPKWKSGSKDAMSKSLQVSLHECLLMLLWMASAPQFNVVANACGGSERATIKVFPDRQFKFYFAFFEKKKAIKPAYTTEKAKKEYEQKQERAQKLKSDRNNASIERLNKQEAYFQAIYLTFKALKAVCDLANKVSDAAGTFSRNKLSIEFAIGLRIEVVFQYVECTELKGRFEKRLKTPARVGRKWELFVGAQPLIGINGYFTFPLLNLIPGVGWLASRVIQLDIYFRAKVNLKIGAFVGRDQYDFCAKAGGKIEGDFWFEAGLSVGIGRWKAIEVGIAFNPYFKGDICLWKEPDCFVGATWRYGWKTIVRVVVAPDSYWWRKELVDKVIESMSYDAPPIEKTLLTHIA